MDESSLTFNTLQHFLSFHKKAVSAKISDIQRTIEKAENSTSFSSKTLSELMIRPTKSSTDTYALRAKNTNSIILQSNISTSLSPGSIIMDSLTDEEFEKRSSIPDLKKAKPTKRHLSVLSPNKGHPLRKSAFGRRHTQVTASPSTKTDPGMSFLSESGTYSPKSKFGSSKSKRYEEKDEDEENQGFLMIKPLSQTAINNDPDSPVFQRQKFSIDLDEDIFPKDIISQANSLYGTSFSSNMKELITRIASAKNRNSTFYAMRPKNEALYSLIIKGKTRDILERILLQLSLKLKEESVSFRQKYKGNIDFLEVKMLKVIREPNNSVKFEQKELQQFSEKISVLMNESCLIASHSSLKTVWNFLQSLLSKFDSPITTQSEKTETCVTAEYLTLPKLLEKAITSHEDSEYHRDVLIHTYDLYISPQNLLLYFIFRYFAPKPVNMSRSELQHFNTTFGNKAKSLILSVIIFWIEERGADFLRTPSLLTILSAFLEVAQSSEKDAGLLKSTQELWKLQQKFTQKVIRNERKSTCSEIETPEQPHSARLELECLKIMPCNSLYESQKMRRQNQRAAKGPGLFSFSKPVVPKVQYTLDMLLAEPVENIVQQLTLLDWKQFSEIELREVLNKRWTKQEKKECPNYWIHVTRFNSFSYWIQYTILSQESVEGRMEIAEKFLKVAMKCIREYQNYCSPNYIFSALFTLCNFGVLSFNEELKKDFEELKSIFAPNGGYIKLYNELFKDLKPPAIPNLNVFLRIFLKLQDGVNFWVTLPESRLKYLKFQPLVQIHDYCKEMKKFQKFGYNEISKDVNLYGFLKTGFQEMIPADLNLASSEEMMKKITQMVGPAKKNQSKLFRFFGLKNI